jgi:hypothetical protein
MPVRNGGFFIAMSNNLFETAYKLIMRSGNSKLSDHGIVAVYAGRQTCPATCPFKSNGCYAEKGNVRYTFDRLTNNDEYGVSFPALIEEIRSKASNTIMRLFVSGDLPTVDGKIDVPLLNKLASVLKKNKVVAWGYTHWWDDEAIAAINTPNLIIHKSVHELDEAVDAFNKGIPVAIAMDDPKPLFEHKGVKFRKCWNQSDKSVTCQRCGWCFDPGKDFAIAFKKH